MNNETNCPDECELKSDDDKSKFCCNINDKECCIENNDLNLENEKLQVEIASLKVEIENQSNKMKEHLANVINESKRLLIQKQNEHELQLKQLLKKYALIIISSVDTFEHVITLCEPGNLKNGLEMTLHQMYDNLNKLGIKSIDQTTILDSHKHEVVGTEHLSDLPDNQIISTKLKGYEIDSFLIRPAQVIINKL